MGSKNFHIDVEESMAGIIGKNLSSYLFDPVKHVLKTAKKRQRVY